MDLDSLPQRGKKVWYILLLIVRLKYQLERIEDFRKHRREIFEMVGEGQLLESARWEI